MSDALHTPVCDVLGCTYPVVLAGMGGVARSELVAAVTKAGGFGFLGMVREPPALIEAEVARVREVTGRPFGVNIIPAATNSVPARCRDHHLSCTFGFGDDAVLGCAACGRAPAERCGCYRRLSDRLARRR